MFRADPEARFVKRGASAPSEETNTEGRRRGERPSFVGFAFSLTEFRPVAETRSNPRGCPGGKHWQNRLGGPARRGKLLRSASATSAVTRSLPP